MTRHTGRGYFKLMIEKNALLRADVENLALRLWFRIDGEMLSGISLNLESVRLFWLALENWNVATSQNQGKAYYEGREGGL